MGKVVNVYRMLVRENGQNIPFIHDLNSQWSPLERKILANTYG
jgi:hypothetical protein